ncbi:transposase [Halorientalis pallida]|uniref:IS200/IS605 family transposon protein TnpB n=1 Tax=Halorientalis pallida TaxID=2479928 RepID=A0A498KXL0_9EURY|nr:transposase [Halorientalis pallida]RXK47712.1 IS200/IS605 family transposon protein TnpB [Halorientalis pallida]
MAAQTEEERTRTNTFQLQPKENWKRVCLIELLDPAAALVNIVTYHRRQAYFDDEQTRNDVWNAITKTEIRDRFQPTLGRAITDKLLDKCDETWDGFFTQLDDYHDGDREDRPSPPGYCKDGGQRVLKTVVRNDAYTVEWGEHSRIELALGSELKEKYGIPFNQRLRVPIRGNPQYEGHGGRLELVYDRSTESFTAHQPVTFRHDTTRAAASGDEDVVAAVDVGANNFVAVTTTNGHQAVFDARPLFDRFHRITERIAELQSQLPDGEHSSRLIEKLYDRRRRQRDHAQDALIRYLARLFEEWGVGEVYVGKLDDVREEHWSAVVNEKTDLFWAHGRFRRRMHEVLDGECGINVEEESEASTSSRCPQCGEEESVGRNGDVFQCGGCGFEGHSDVVGSENFLSEVVDGNVEFNTGRPMARPADSGQNGPEWRHREVPRLEWDDHEWRRRGHSTKEEPANRSTRKGNLASGVSR